MRTAQGFERPTTRCRPKPTADRALVDTAVQHRGVLRRAQGESDGHPRPESGRSRVYVNEFPSRFAARSAATSARTPGAEERRQPLRRPIAVARRLTAGRSQRDSGTAKSNCSSCRKRNSKPAAAATVSSVTPQSALPCSTAAATRGGSGPDGDSRQDEHLRAADRPGLASHCRHCG